MKRICVALLTCGVCAIGLVLPAMASAYTFKLTPQYCVVTCEGNYQTGGAGKWNNTSWRSHWSYDRADKRGGAHYYIRLFNGSSLVHDIDVTGVLCDEWWNPGGTAHWYKWSVNRLTTRGKTRADWQFWSPRQASASRTTSY